MSSFEKWNLARLLFTLQKTLLILPEFVLSIITVYLPRVEEIEEPSNTDESPLIKDKLSVHNFERSFNKRNECSIKYFKISTHFIHGGIVRVVACTAKNTVISPDFLVWKFCGKAQFPHSFGRFARKYAETVLFRKISTPGNQVNLRYFSQCCPHFPVSKTMVSWNMLLHTHYISFLKGCGITKNNRPVWMTRDHSFSTHTKLSQKLNILSYLDLTLTHFWAMLIVYNPLKTAENLDQCSHFIPSEKLWFSGVFRGYKMGTMARNGLISSGKNRKISSFLTLNI